MPRYETTYEDLYYFAEQLADSEEGESENPAIGAALKQLAAELTPELVEATAYGISNFGELMRETVNLIHDAVWRNLSDQPRDLRHIKPITHLLASNSFASVAIGTLNHDTHLEKTLLAQGIRLSDGFSDPVRGVRYWKAASFDLAQAPFLFKLHGSVDWFHFRQQSQDAYDFVGSPIDGDCDHCEDEDGTFLTAAPYRPVMLIGTFNKIARYSDDLFLGLHWRFRSFLSRADRLAICGYGFAEKGINSAIINWLYEQRGRRVIVIHRDPDDLATRARGAIAHKWPGWTESGTLVLVRKWIQELQPAELVDLFVDS